MSAKRRIQYPVTEKALLARINRKLAAEGRGEAVRKARCGIGVRNLGQFFVLGPGRITETHIDIVALAKELGVLRAWEELVEDEDDDD